MHGVTMKFALRMSFYFPLRSARLIARTYFCKVGSTVCPEFTSPPFVNTWKCGWLEVHSGNSSLLLTDFNCSQFAEIVNLLIVWKSKDLLCPSLQCWPHLRNITVTVTA